MRTTFRNIFLVILIIFNLSSIIAQNINSNKKLLFKSALQKFDNEEFFKALPLFLEYDSLYPNDFEANYYIGACYLNTPYQKTEGIPYLEFAIKNDKKLLPDIVFKDLASLYQLEYKFDSAIANYKRFLKISFNDDIYNEYVKKTKIDCEYAKEKLIDTYTIDINPVCNEINDNNSNEFPFISTDDELMFFTRTYRKLEGVVYIDSVSTVMYSKKVNGKWQKPDEVKVQFPENTKSAFLVGISPQGTELFFRVEIDSINSDLYVCKFEGDSCISLTSFNKKINSKFKESMCSITADGKDFYFTSNRPGGYGGLDIYRICKIDDENWGPPINLGNEINTPFDEDGPFIHPDKQTLYFSSKGHLGYGGYDFYTSEYQFFENSWSEPTNLNYPLNTTYNDIGIYLTADASSAYFSSSKNDTKQRYSIYNAKFSNSIPLTLVKGTISDENNNPIKARIKVVEHESQERIKYVYNPNPNTGKYLMIFPPGKNYDMIIEAEGYISHVVNIYIPDQTYFYSLYQEIHLEKLKLNKFDKQIGEKISVTNTFYDIYDTELIENDDTTNSNVKINKPDYTNLLEIIDKLITKTDSIGVNQLDSITEYEDEKIKVDARSKNYDNLLDLVEDAIETTDSSSLEQLDKNTMYNDNFIKSYFFDSEDEEKGLKDIIIAGDTIKTFSPLNTTDKQTDNNEIVSVIQNSNNPDIKINKQFDFTNSSINSRKYILNYSVYFSSNKSKLKLKYRSKLLEISKLLMNNPDLGLEINGYTDAKGNEKDNLLLSTLRARAVMQLFVENYVKPQRIILKGYGETKSVLRDNEKDRRVDINVFQISKIKELNILNNSSEEEINKVYPINDSLIIQEQIIYKVQIASCLKFKDKKDEVFKNLKVDYYKYGKCMNYTYGKYKTIEDANEALRYVVSKGFNDAFIVKFVDNKRIN